ADRVGQRPGERIGMTIHIADEVIGERVKAAAKNLRTQELLLLENLRFHPGEQKGDVSFARVLAELGDLYINDAFGTCHRTDASMVALPQAMIGKPRVVGLLVAKELDILGQLLSSPKRPFIVVLGGAKVSDRSGFLKGLLKRVYG